MDIRRILLLLFAAVACAAGSFLLGETLESPWQQALLVAALGFSFATFACAGGWARSLRLRAPLERIAGKMQDMVDGRVDPTAKLPEGTVNDVACLCQGVNRLMDAFARLLSLNQAVLDSVPDPLFMVDADKRVQLANAATARLTGKPLAVLAGMRCAEILDTDACSTSRCPLTPGMRDNLDDVCGQHVVMSRDGVTRYFKASVRSVVDSQGATLGWLNLVQDVTAAVDRESALERHVQTVEVVNAAVTKVSQKINESIASLFGKVEEVNDGAKLQQNRVEETVTSMQQMTAAARNVSDNAQTASTQAREARETAQEGETLVRQASGAIQAVRRQTELLQENMAGLGRRAQDIGRILTVISDIADQTNLLALNAAIEAARAGTEGRGFAVVADEVRKLAEKTMQATGEVNQAITAIRQETRASLSVTEQAVRAVDDAARMSGRSGETLGHIVDLVGQTARQVEIIAAAAKEQSQVSENINRALSDVSAVSLSTAKGMDESSEALLGLSTLAGRLRQAIHSGGTA